MTTLRDLLAPRVEAGAKLLDERRPGWADRISLDDLGMDSCWRCVLGQLWGDYDTGLIDLGISIGDSYDYGFDIGESGRITLDEGLFETPEEDWSMAVWPTLNELWVEQIRARRTPAGVTG